jgi:hypothetical protein
MICIRAPCVVVTVVEIEHEAVVVGVVGAAQSISLCRFADRRVSAPCVSSDGFLNHEVHSLRNCRVSRRNDFGVSTGACPAVPRALPRPPGPASSWPKAGAAPSWLLRSPWKCCDCCRRWTLLLKRASKSASRQSWAAAAGPAFVMGGGDEKFVEFEVYRLDIESGRNTPEEANWSG